MKEKKSGRQFIFTTFHLFLTFSFCFSVSFLLLLSLILPFPLCFFLNSLLSICLFIPFFLYIFIYFTISFRHFYLSIYPFLPFFLYLFIYFTFQRQIARKSTGVINSFCILVTTEHFFGHFPLAFKHITFGGCRRCIFAHPFISAPLFTRLPVRYVPGIFCSRLRQGLSS